MYNATVLGFQNGYFRVQWDGAQTTAWVPTSAARPLGGNPPPPSAPAAAPPPAPWELGLPQNAAGAQPGGAAATPRPNPAQGNAPAAQASAPSAAPAQSAPARAIASAPTPQFTPAPAPRPVQAPTPAVAPTPAAAMTPAPIVSAGATPAVAPTPAVSASPVAPTPAFSASPVASMPAASAVATPVVAGTMRGGAQPSQLAGIEELPRGLVFEPTSAGPGTGKAFYFFFALSPLVTSDGKIMRIQLDQMGDDVAALRASGYRVIVTLLSDLAGLVQCLKNEHPDGGGTKTAGVFWTSHGGPDGRIEDWQGRRFGPTDLGEGLSCPDLKMFVMSACYVANHAEKWQKALGEGVKIFGWGAPITGERAADFLRQDETTSKGFDDLLALHLGAARKTAEGPLVEAVELIERLAKRLTGHLPSYEELIDIVSSRCVVKPAKLDGAPNLWGFLIPRFVEGRPKPRTQGVRTTLFGDWVYVSSTVGPYSDLIDLTKALKLVSDTTFTRVFLSKPPEGPPFIIVSATSTLRGLSAGGFWGMIATVGDTADELEDAYFGSDDR